MLAPVDGVSVGLVWAGNLDNPREKDRSIRPEALGPILDVPGVSFVSLQKRQANSGEIPAGMLDIAEEFRDFADTAAVIENLDLVITVDTAVAHLAGAMGKPVWIMLPFVPDWRWMLDREDSPWYPTARLFRQGRAREWGPVIRRVANELTALAGGDKSRLEPVKST